MKNTMRIIGVLLIGMLFLPSCGAFRNDVISQVGGRIFTDLVIYQGYGFAFAVEILTIGTAMNFGQSDRFQFLTPLDEINDVLNLDEFIKKRNQFEYFKMEIDSINIDYFADDTLIAESRIVEINMRNVESILTENNSFFERCANFKTVYNWGFLLKGEGNISFTKVESDSNRSISEIEKNAHIEEELTILNNNSEGELTEKDCPYIAKTIYNRIDGEQKMAEKAEVTSYFTIEFRKTSIELSPKNWTVD